MNTKLEGFLRETPLNGFQGKTLGKMQFTMYTRGLHSKLQSCPTVYSTVVRNKYSGILFFRRKNILKAIAFSNGDLSPNRTALVVLPAQL